MNMIKYGLSFLLGVYVGTYFDCKPHLKQVEQFIKENLPEKK